MDTSFDEALSGLGLRAHPDTPAFTRRGPTLSQLASGRVDNPWGYGGAYDSMSGPGLEPYSQGGSLVGGDPFVTPSLPSCLREGGGRLRGAPGGGVRFSDTLLGSREGDSPEWGIRRRWNSAENLIGLDSPRKGSGLDTSWSRDRNRWEEDFLSPMGGSVIPNVSARPTPGRGDGFDYGFSSGTFPEHHTPSLHPYAPGSRRFSAPLPRSGADDQAVGQLSQSLPLGGLGSRSQRPTPRQDPPVAPFSEPGISYGNYHPPQASQSYDLLTGSPPPHAHPSHVQDPWAGGNTPHPQHSVPPRLGGYASTPMPYPTMMTPPYQQGPSAYPGTTACGLGDEGGRVAHVRPQLGVPDTHTPFLGPLAQGPAPVPHLPTSAPQYPRSGGYATGTGRHAPKYKDLRYDGKSSWKSFLHKFARLARSQQWTEPEQHDQFCFSLEGTASDYYTLLLDTDRNLSLTDILRRFEKRFGSSAPDLSHQLNFQSASQNAGESLRHWADRVLTLATQAFPSVPDVHTHAIPRLCYGAEDRDAGLYALDGQPKTVEEAVDRMQYYQHSRQTKSSKPRRDVRQVAQEEAPDFDKELREMRQRLQEIEKELRGRTPSPRRPSSPPLSGNRKVKGPRPSLRTATRRSNVRQNHGGRGTKTRQSQFSGGPTQREVRVLTPERSPVRPGPCDARTGTGRFAGGHRQAPSCMRRSRKGTLQVRFKEASEEEEESDDWVIGWEEDKYEPSPKDMLSGFRLPEDIVVPELPRFGAENQGDGEEFPEDSEDLPDQEPSLIQEEQAGAYLAPRPSECPEPVKAQVQPKEECGLGVVSGQAEDGTVDMPCRHAGEAHEELPVPIGQIRPTTGFMVEMVVQGVRLQAVVDTGAEMSVLSTRVYEELDPKPPIKQHVTLVQAGENARMRGFVIGPVAVCLGDTEHNVDLYVAPLQDQMLLGMEFLHQQKAHLDLEHGTMTLGKEKVPMTFGRPGGGQEAQVSVTKSIRVPAASVVLCPCHLDKELEDFVVSPQITRLSNLLLVPHTYHTGGRSAVTCFINASDEDVSIPEGSVIGSASEAGFRTPTPDIVRNVCSVANPHTDSGAEVPEHLKDLLDRSSKELTPEERRMLADLLNEFQDVFATGEFDFGNFTALEHEIDTGEARPVKERMRRTPLFFVDEEEAHLKKMLDAGVIQPSVSEWASAPVLIRKKDGQVRWCLDYRKLNDVTRKDVFPLPLIDECLDTLTGNVWFSKLDANSAFHQIKISPKDRKKTDFVTKYGLFEFVRMGFGLCNAPATFSRAMSLVLRGLTWSIVLAFLDDALVLGKDFQGHLDNLKAVFRRFREFDLKFKPKKCELFQTKVEFLGRQVSGKGIEMGDTYIAAVREWAPPTNVKEVERFLGFANYHRTFIAGYAQLACPLYQVTGKKPFEWGHEQRSAFDALKKALTSPPTLAMPIAEGMFVLDTDASGEAIGAELSQIQDGVEKPIAYGSLGLNRDQRKYCTTRRELLAVVRFTRMYRHYLLGRRFRVRTDHHSLIWLLNFKSPQDQLARWLEELSQYNMEIQHRPGQRHINADALSRLPHSSCASGAAFAIHPSDLPCGGCLKCTKAHQSWNTFVEEVDDVAPLARPGTWTYLEEPSSDEEIDLAEDSAINLAQCKPGVVPEGHSPEISEAAWNYVSREILGPPSQIVDLESDDTASGPFRTQVRLLTSPQIPAVVRTLTDTGSGSLSLVGMTADEMMQSQQQDADLKLFGQWLSTDGEPAEGELFLASPALKNYWIDREFFMKDEDQVLWKLVGEGESRSRLLVVPRELREEVLRLCHDVPASGHQGISRTKARLRERFFWYGMMREVEGFVSTCGPCSRNKHPQRHARAEMIKYHAGAPMERVHLDFLGPLPRTDSGNEYVLVMVDQFTKWVECVPLPSQTAEVTASAAVNQFFARFGCPFQVFTDQGRNFESKLFAAVCELLKIHKARTTPYRPSANGQVERYNRTLMDAVRCYIDKAQNSWDIHLAQIAGALRSSVNRSTGFTANKLMLGRETNTPADLMYAPPIRGEDLDLEDYVVNLEKSIQAAHEIARARLRTTEERMKRDYDLRVRFRAYQEGDTVYVLDTATVKGKCRKLSPSWKGPGLVVQKLSAHLYRVRTKTTVMLVNHDRMKKCEDRDLPRWLANARERYLAEKGSCQAIDEGVHARTPTGAVSEPEGIPRTQDPASLQDPEVAQVPPEEPTPTLKRRRGRPRKHRAPSPAPPRAPSGKTRYCLCRQADDGKLMIQCDRCEEWFHGKCVGVTLEDAERLDNYVCSPCSCKGTGGSHLLLSLCRKQRDAESEGGPPPGAGGESGHASRGTTPRPRAGGGGGPLRHPAGPAQ
ncbi:uncharacterized protein LOC130046578 [Ostrea edulis]|uniref:uncharacterized protein LOC130046578 n=1 Tax=Ostrea edulis TaxID=37623 RepID=UPI0024AF4C0D|nr:uncharacterized protein LOC130046578 [Ostrea edulis]